ESFVHAAGQRVAGVGDQRQVLGARIALGPGFLLFDGYVAAVFHLVAERSYARVQIGDAHGGRTHIDAAAVLPEIERRADDGDVGAWHVVLLHCTGGHFPAETQRRRDMRRETRSKKRRTGERRGPSCARMHKAEPYATKTRRIRCGGARVPASDGTGNPRSRQRKDLPPAVPCASAPPLCGWRRRWRTHLCSSAPAAWSSAGPGRGWQHPSGRADWWYRRAAPRSPRASIRRRRA